MESSIWVLAHVEDHGDRGIVTELAYEGPYGTNTCPAFESKEAAERYIWDRDIYSYFKPLELVLHRWE